MSSLADKKYLGQPLWFLVALPLLLIQRLFHFGEHLDSPHLWRQADTAHYIYDFYQNGIDFLHPAVCWMGPYKTLILEFPAHEAIAALLYQAFGPSHIWARLVTFAFFLLALWWFFRIVRYVSNERVARLATIVYACLPLTLFFSRAVHIDFMAIALAHGMFYFFLKGLKEERWKPMIVGSLLAIPAFLVKAPYAFFFALPLFWWTWKHKRWKMLFMGVPLYLVPLALFYWWVKVSKGINSEAPDWQFINGYHKFNEMFYWYFGTWEQRLSWEYGWGKLLPRFPTEVLRWSGMVLMLVATFFSRKVKGMQLAWWWLAGATVYVLIFFNLNAIHDYYQLPLVAPFSLLIAMGLEGLSDKLSGMVKRLLPLALLLILITESVGFAEFTYYQKPADILEIAEQIGANTSADDVVIVTYGGLNQHYPGILYQARRIGWSIRQQDKSPELYIKLYNEGATALAFVSPDLPEGEMREFMNYIPLRAKVKLNDPQNHFLFIFDLREDELRARQPTWK